MNILIACEESQTSCKVWRSHGHNAFSCDLLPCSGGFPEWHIQGDVLPLLNGCCHFETMDGHPYFMASRWDLIIAHPPCTYLSKAGNRWFNISKYGDSARKRYLLRDDAIAFFMNFVNCDCEHVAIENPVGFMSSFYRKPDQIINPYDFGDPYSKATCLWLKNLPLLQPDLVVPHDHGEWYASVGRLPADERQRIRSKTFQGIAESMYFSWGWLFED